MLRLNGAIKPISSLPWVLFQGISGQQVVVPASYSLGLVPSSLLSGILLF
jgi:hypothetical protein